MKRNTTKRRSSTTRTAHAIGSCIDAVRPRGPGVLAAPRSAARRPRALGAIALILGAVLLAADATAASAAIPVPEQDPFYAVPANIASLANGTVLSSRQIDASALGLPLP
jgi:hypothetical protein